MITCLISRKRNPLELNKPTVDIADVGTEDSSNSRTLYLDYLWAQEALSVSYGLYGLPSVFTIISSPFCSLNPFLCLYMAPMASSLS